MIDPYDQWAEAAAEGYDSEEHRKQAERDRAGAWSEWKYERERIAQEREDKGESYE